MSSSVVPGPGYIVPEMVHMPKTKLEAMQRDLVAAGCGTKIISGEIEINEERTHNFQQWKYWGGRFKTTKGPMTLYCVLNVSNGIGSVVYKGAKAAGLIKRIINSRKEKDDERPQTEPNSD